MGDIDCVLAHVIFGTLTDSIGFANTKLSFGFNFHDGQINIATTFYAQLPTKFFKFVLARNQVLEWAQ